VNNDGELVLGVMAGALVPAAIIVVALVGGDLLKGGGVDVGSAGVAFVFAAAAALLVLVFYGLPVFFLLRKWGYANIVSCAAAAIAPVAFFGILGDGVTFGGAMIQLGFTLASAVTFWYFARRTVK
jgi:hypothetical protein